MRGTEVLAIVLAFLSLYLILLHPDTERTPSRPVPTVATSTLPGDAR